MISARLPSALAILFLMIFIGDAINFWPKKKDENEKSMEFIIFEKNDLNPNQLTYNVIVLKLIGKVKKSRKFNKAFF